MSNIRCPRCDSFNLEYVPSVDLLQCLDCSIVIWNEDILNKFKYPTYAPLKTTKRSQITDNFDIDL